MPYLLPIALAVILSPMLSSATLKIVTSDWYDARMAGITVIIEHKAKQRQTIRTITGLDGVVELDLPSGAYTIKASSNEFGVHERSPIWLPEAARKTVYLHPIFISAVGHASCIASPEECPIERKTVKSFSRFARSRAPVAPGTLYFESELIQDGLRFSGTPVVLTWDQYAFYATQITCNRQRSICRGEGGASVELASQRIPVDRFEVDIQAQTVTWWKDNRNQGIALKIR